ncbi:MAG: ATP-binding protein [Panacibacter sp.]
MYKRIYIIFFLLAITFAQLNYAQTKKIDSLKKIVDATTGIDNKIKAITAYCEDYANIHHDSLERYAYIALDLAQQTKDERLKSLAALTLAQDYMNWGWADSVLEVVNKELPKNPVTDDARRDIYFRLARLKAVAFGSGGQLQESLEVLYPLVPLAEKYKDTLVSILVSTSIGFVATSRKEMDEAKKWNNKAFQYLTSGNRKYFGSVYFSRAMIFNALGNTDSALAFLQKAIELCKEAENIDRLTSCYRLQSSILGDQGKLKEAEDALMNMISTRKLTNNNPDAVIEDNLQIADFYVGTGQLKRAIQLCRDKIITGDLHNKSEDGEKAFANDPAVRLQYYLALAEYLKEDKDYTAYQESLEQIILLKDSVYEQNKAEAIAELQTKYEVEQKENTIISQQLLLTKRNYLLYGSVGFTVMAAVIATFIVNNQRRRQKEKMEKAIDDEKRSAAASILEAEEKERKRIAADLHDNIGAYATAIRDDVDKINVTGSESTTNHLNNLRQNSQEIINSLRDTIWVLNKDNITITGISDRFKNYINKLQPSYPGINISITEDLDNDVYINSRRALNIFRIMQEAVHNALKHSGAENIIITINSTDHVQIRIADDGKGMDDLNSNTGNGLGNMQSRAAEAGMQIKIESQKNKGTTILLEPTT